jgi:hypothetical protein
MHIPHLPDRRNKMEKHPRYLGLIKAALKTKDDEPLRSLFREFGVKWTSKKLPKFGQIG